jgi:20S proteasome alpha/beta subunit
MTLIAAFRASQGGVLLCSDREEDDGISKKSVDKICRIRELTSCEVFIAGAGPSTPIKNTNTEIHSSLKQYEDSGGDLVKGHHQVIESSLKSIYKRYAKVLQTWPMNLIVVVAPRAKGYVPILYHTDGEMLCPEPRYVAHGSGKAIADYLVGRLFADDLMTHWLLILAAFIFRESESSSSGVGFGCDMVLIHNGRKELRMIDHEALKEVERGLPPIVECLHECWMEAEKSHRFPGWLYNE